MSTDPRPLRLRTLLATLVLASGLLLAMLGRPAPAEAQVSAMLPDQLKNLTYPSTYTVSGFAPLRDGKYDQRAALNDLLKPALVTFIQSSTGTDFSAVLLATNTSGSGVFVTLHLVRAQNGVATAGPGIFLGDRLKIEGVALTDEGCFIVSYITQGPGEPLCCGTKRETREYVPDANTFRLISVDGVAVALAQAPTPPRTGNLGTRSTSAGTALLAILAAALLPLASRRLVRTEVCA